MEILRRIVFYIFFAAYVILCPLLILYSLGYVVYPLNEKMVHTGVVYLSSRPAEAQVFLEKSRYKERTPATIRDLLPGEYTIRLELKDHHPWNQKVLVEDGKAASFEKILLIPNNWNTRIVAVGPFTDLMPLAGTGYILLSTGQQLKDHHIYDWKKDALRPFLPATRDMADLRVSAFYAKDDSPAVVIQGGPIWERKYFYAQMTAEGTDIRDISKLVTGRPLQMDWDPSSHDSIFALYEGYADRLDTTSLALYPEYIEGLRGWGVARNQIFVIDRNDQVVSSSTGRNDFKPAFDSPGLAEIFAREKDFYEIRPLSGECIVFLGAHSAVILNHLRAYFIDQAITGVRYDPENGQILVWTPKAIGIFDLSVEEASPPSAESAVKVRWVFEQGRDIRQCFWAHEGTHVVFRDGNRTFLLEPEPQGPAHVDLVTASLENAPVAYVEAKGVLYYLGETDGKLYALDIISQKGPRRPSFLETPEPGKGER